MITRYHPCRARGWHLLGSASIQYDAILKSDDIFEKTSDILSGSKHAPTRATCMGARPVDMTTAQEAILVAEILPWHALKAKITLMGRESME
jgi:hypothetical protein